MAEAKGGDPLATGDGRGAVELLGPRRCGATTPASASRARPGLVNVRFLALNRVAELLGAPFLAEPDRVPLTPEARLDATRVALGRGAGRVRAGRRPPVDGPRARGRVRGPPGRGRRARSTASSRPGPRAASVVDCYRRFRALTAGPTTTRTSSRPRPRSWPTHGVPADVGALLLFCPERLTPGGTAARRRLRGAHVHRRPCSASPATPTRTAETRDAGRRASRPRSASRSDSGPATLGHGDRVISAPDPESEVREVVRALVERVDAGGTPPRRRGRVAGRRAPRPAAPRAAGRGGHPGLRPVDPAGRRHGHRPHPARAASTSPSATSAATTSSRCLAGAPDPRGGRRRPDADGPVGPDLAATPASSPAPTQWRDRLARRRDEILERAGDEDPEWVESGWRTIDRLARFVAELTTRDRRVVRHLGRVVRLGHGARRPLPRPAAVVAGPRPRSTRTTTCSTASPRSVR